MARRALGTTIVAAAIALVAGSAPPSRVRADAVEHRILEYSVVDTETDQELYRLRGWSEDVPGEPPRVAALSHVLFPAGNRIEVRVLFSHDTPPRCLSWEAFIRDRDGDVVGSTREVVVQDAFPFLRRSMPPDTYPPLAPLGYVLTRLGLGEKEHASFHVILMGSSVLSMDLSVDARERVVVPAGEFDAYRVRMRVNPESLFPNLPAFARPFVAFFIPTHTLWLSASAPQMLVKFSGQMGPPGSPKLRVDLISVTEPTPPSSRP